MVSRGTSLKNTILLLAISLMFVGCDTNSELQKLSDREMRAKVKECKTMKSPAPAMVFACENYQRECDRRAEKAGHFVC